ncbi:MAG: hypothetical protein RLZZ337_858 [Bacteroidota bacterium]|jgi:hypothetical protein
MVFSGTFKRTLRALLLVFITGQVIAQQTILTSSNLPIVVITTDIDPNTNKPFEIPDEPKVPASMKIIYRPDTSRNYLTDIDNAAFLNYDGKIGIELRGSSSQTLDKKPYGLTTLENDNESNNNVSLLGMPAENDWVLNSLAFDPSMIRDYLSYTLAANMGNYAPRVHYVEVIVNDDYKGVYILTEKLKIDGDRIDIEKLSTSDNTFPNVTGGYIIKADKTNPGEEVSWTMPSYDGWDVDFLHENPKAKNITSQQDDYIQGVFFDLAQKANQKNASIATGYPTIIDVPSFVDYMIMSEFASNPDSYRFSTFFHKDRGGKLRAGPVWDYNLSFGNDLFVWGFDRSFYDVWQFDYENIGPKFWKDLFNESNFRCYLSKRWFELTATDQPLNYNIISNQIDSYTDLLYESQQREQTRWGTVDSQMYNIAAMKLWIENRIDWIDKHIGSAANCSNVSTPPLVISRIHYNPADETGFESDDLEFIEITNNSNSSVNVTGYYIKELGISYQFPANTSIIAQQKIYLCSNASAFKDFYGFTPFGEYERDLKNSSYNIVLSDAFGNTIDEVRYFDEAPWPEGADGDGPYLQIKNVFVDNNKADNWVLSTQKVSSADEAILMPSITAYPNPTNGVLHFNWNNSLYASLDCTIYNTVGQVIGIYKLNAAVYQIDLSVLENGIYFYEVTNGDKLLMKNKILKL